MANDERTAEYYEKSARQYEEKSGKYSEISLEVVALFLRHGLRVCEANTVLDCVSRVLNSSPVAQHEE